MTTTHNQAQEAKSIVATAFRNGPIEDVHAGENCPTCSRNPEYSGITDEEMKTIMKTAVNRIYTLLQLKQNDPQGYDQLIRFGALYTHAWDEPAVDETTQEAVSHLSAWNLSE